MMLVENPQYSTVVATMKLQLYKLGDQYLYVDGTPVKIGSSISIQFPQAVFPDARILEIEK